MLGAISRQSLAKLPVIDHLLIVVGLSTESPATVFVYGRRQKRVAVL